MKNRVRDAAIRFFEFVMQTTKRTTAPVARLAEKFSQTAAYPGFWGRTGRELSMNWKLLSDADASKCLMLVPSIINKPRTQLINEPLSKPTAAAAARRRECLPPAMPQNYGLFCRSSPVASARPPSLALTRTLSPPACQVWLGR
jgi:hypothetical protein